MQNSFELFDLPVVFEVDLNLLSARYLALQKALHPDNFASKSEQEQRVALQQSAQINDAYQQLKDPILRAEAILAIGLGQEIDKENTTHDLDFLMEQMALREQLEEIEQGHDEAALEQFQQDLAEKNRLELTALSAEIASQNWSEVKLHIDRLKFVRKLHIEVERIEERFWG
ncbi:Fe-S protein assembly co-chaperone HscB [Conservatibacter flavescens]|uniref:Co-chaperone protein HscB homolog n=1 Tax=Conservatibacter flavescens TaxID=28161 RepID=A0A2M8S3N9_9PAST|nr:Fe-S protein assembly co-chaperone HscB [Conservatibacter flavescens]PJG85769.1 Fe-S protein assembly co-chaperone HscB [Conservatibacter flavescens]